MSNEPISGASFALRGPLNEKQVADLDIGLTACGAFWRAAQCLPSYDVEILKPHGRCIYAALAVRDILHQLGKKDTRVEKVGLDVRQYRSNTTTILNSLRIGTADYKDTGTEKRWNAHLIVRLGDVFIDPSIAQTRRPWNDMPHFSAMINAAPEDYEIDIDGNSVKTKPVWVQQAIGSDVQISYFELPRELDIKTRGYQKAPDAKPEARIDVVREALDILSSSEATSATGENAI